jgi:hypothetical protein
MICMEDHYKKDYPHREEVNKFLKGTSLPVVLTDPFLVQQHQMVVQNTTPPQGGNSDHSYYGDASSSIARVFMCKDTVSITTIFMNYDTVLDNHANGGASIHSPHPLILHRPPLFKLRG